MSTDAATRLRILWQQVFPDPDAFLDAFFSLAYSPDRCRYLEEAGEIVSALYWFDCEYRGRKLAYLYAVATRPDCRGRGLASRLILQTHRELKARGYAGAVLKPAKGLFPFYEGLGYATCGYVRRFEAQAGAEPARLQRLTGTEYAARRRVLLPEGGIVQEGVALDLLGSFADFYALEDALFCVVPEEAVLPEYLGDPRHLPAVLAALGLNRGEITTPGGELPFAMYCPLDGTPAPEYLGLSLE